MKTIPVFFFSFLFFISLHTYCQVAETPAQKIRRLEDLERTSVMKGDTAVLFKLWSPDYVVNNPGNMILTAGQIKGFVRISGMDYSFFTRNIEKMTFIKDVAIVMGSEVVSPKNKLDNGGKNMYRRYTNIWIKSDTTWLLSARQATNTLIQ
jgi:Domain of unknown function (DUF4440)